MLYYNKTNQRLHKLLTNEAMLENTTQVSYFLYGFVYKIK